MRNVARFLIIGCLTILPAAAQRGGGGHGGGFHGGGGVGFHSGGGGFRAGSGFHGGGFYGGGFRGGYGGFRGGFGRGFYGHNRYFFGFGLGFYPYSYWPYYYDYGYPYYGYPKYGYGYSYPYSAYDYGYGYSSAPAVVYQSDPAPPLTIYESPRTARPETREYSTGASPQSNEKPIYLIAFKNQDNLRAAEAYWVTGGTLHFITLQHEQRQAPLDSVDRALTYRLNRERRVDFHLPATE
jgi:hypothetical protein